MKPFETGIDNEETKRYCAKPKTSTVLLCEDCGGGLHLWQAGRIWAIGTMSGYESFKDDAESLARGGVWFDGWLGQTGYPAQELIDATRHTNATICIAEYNPTRKTVTIRSDVAIGAAGREYLGLSATDE